MSKQYVKVITTVTLLQRVPIEHYSTDDDKLSPAEALAYEEGLDLETQVEALVETLPYAAFRDQEHPMSDEEWSNTYPRASLTRTAIVE